MLYITIYCYIVYKIYKLWMGLYSHVIAVDSQPVLCIKSFHAQLYFPFLRTSHTAAFCRSNMLEFLFQSKCLLLPPLQSREQEWPLQPWCNMTLCGVPPVSKVLSQRTYTRCPVALHGSFYILIRGWLDGDVKPMCGLWRGFLY